MRYDVLYDKLLTKVREDNRVFNPVLYELHHIIPKCIGGKDEEENLILLTPREHFLAHWLLTKIHKNHTGLVYALHMMCVGRKHKIPNSRLYQLAREKYLRIREENKDTKYIDFMKNASETVWMKKDTKNKRVDKEEVSIYESNGWVKGRVYFSRISPTESTRQKMSNSKRGKGGRKGVSTSLRGKTYEDIFGKDKAKQMKKIRKETGTGRICSKYRWLLISPEKNIYYVENINLIDFFWSVGIPCRKGISETLRMSNKTGKPIHHGKMKGWQAVKELKKNS
jgi:hypothetical protein